MLVTAVVVHVGGLWIASPPDMLDALTFTSPTPFSPFGVIAMWAIFAVALLAAFRRRLGLRRFRILHMALAAVIVVGTVVHAALIEGTMETLSKAALCMLVLGAATKVMADLVRRLRAASRRRPCPTVTEQNRSQSRSAADTLPSSHIGGSAMAGPYTPTGGSKVATVLRVTSGNFLEMFDFFLFGFYASYISKAFFPTGNELAS